MPAVHPAPTVTTSTFGSFAIEVCPLFSNRAGSGSGLHADHLTETLRNLGRAVLQLIGAVVVLGAGIPDQIPAGEVLISAIHRVTEHAFDGVVAQLGEESDVRRTVE